MKTWETSILRDNFFLKGEITSPSYQESSWKIIMPTISLCTVKQALFMLGGNARGDTYFRRLFENEYQELSTSPSLLTVWFHF